MAPLSNQLSLHLLPAGQRPAGAAMHGSHRGRQPTHRRCGERSASEFRPSFTSGDCSLQWVQCMSPPVHCCMQVTAVVLESLQASHSQHAAHHHAPSKLHAHRPADQAERGPPIPAGTPFRDGASIMHALKASEHTEQLAAAVRQHSPSSAWNVTHSSAALTHLTQLLNRHVPHAGNAAASRSTAPSTTTSAHALAAHLAAQVWQGREELRARQVANVTWALARLSHSHVLPLRTVLQLRSGWASPPVSQLMHTMAMQASSRWAALQPLELSSLAYGLALAGWAPHLLTSSPPQQPPQPPEASQYSSSSSVECLGPMVTPGAWLAGLLRRATECIGDMSPQGLSNTLWALAAWLPAQALASHRALLSALLAQLWATTTPQLLSAVDGPR